MPPQLHTGKLYIWYVGEPALSRQNKVVYPITCARLGIYKRLGSFAVVIAHASEHVEILGEAEESDYYLYICPFILAVTKGLIMRLKPIVSHLVWV